MRKVFVWFLLCLFVDLMPLGCSRNVSTLQAGSCIERIYSTDPEGTVRCLPKFMIVGAMKCGTGALMKVLQHHSQTCLGSAPGRRELHFFTNRSMESIHPDHLSPKQSRSIALDYLQYFPAVRRRSVTCFEKSPDYMRSPRALALLHALFPSMKLIITLRHPSIRALSEFIHHCRHGRYIITKASVEIPLQDSNGTTIQRRTVQAGEILRLSDEVELNPFVIHEKYLSYLQFDRLSYPCSVSQAIRYFSGEFQNHSGFVPPEIENSLYSVQLRSIYSR